MMPGTAHVTVQLNGVYRSGFERTLNIPWRNAPINPSRLRWLSHFECSLHHGIFVFGLTVDQRDMAICASDAILAGGEAKPGPSCLIGVVYSPYEKPDGTLVLKCSEK